MKKHTYIAIGIILLFAVTLITNTVTNQDVTKQEIADEYKEIEQKIDNENTETPLLDTEYVGPNENDGLPNQSRYLIPSDES